MEILVCQEFLSWKFRTSRSIVALMYISSENIFLSDSNFSKISWIETKKGKCQNLGFCVVNFKTNFVKSEIPLISFMFSLYIYLIFVYIWCTMMEDSYYIPANDTRHLTKAWDMTTRSVDVPSRPYSYPHINVCMTFWYFQ